MSVARKRFIDRIDSFRHASKKPDLRNNSLVGVLENEASRYLRNGLQIMIFCSVEDFLRERVVELFAKPTFAGIRFQNLPTDLQKMLVIDSTEAMTLSSKYDQGLISDPVNDFVREITIISNSANENMPYSKFAFGKNKSNISFDDIERFLKCCGVGAAATGMGSISMRAGFNIAGGPRGEFTNFARKRYSAAHDSQCAIELNDLEDSIRFGVAFCLAFDILATVAINQLCSAQPAAVDGTKINLKAVCERTNGEWGEHKLQGPMRKRATRVHPNEESATISSRTKLGESEGLIIQNLSGLPVRWFV